jgi:hypothetical protein
MMAIWQNDGTDWRLLASTRFPYEQTLYGLVKGAPRIRPLAGDPVRLFFGRSVR